MKAPHYIVFDAEFLEKKNAAERKNLSVAEDS